MWSFILAMTLHPELQKQAQQEIDCVTGGERLPEFSDLKSMPYIEAIFQETLRWGCPVTLSRSFPIVKHHSIGAYTACNGRSSSFH